MFNTSDKSTLVGQLNDMLSGLSSPIRLYTQPEVTNSYGMKGWVAQPFNQEQTPVSGTLDPTTSNAYTQIISGYISGAPVYAWISGHGPSKNFVKSMNGPHDWQFVSGTIPGNSFKVAPLAITKDSFPTGANLYELNINGQVVIASTVSPTQVSGLYTGISGNI